MSSQIQKRKKGQVLNSNERQLIMNLINYLREKHSEKSISEVIREISKATGCSERTIYKIRKDATKGITFLGKKARFRKKENKNSRNIKYDTYVKSSIRKKVYNFFLQNVQPTLNGILSLVNQDPELPNFKRSTLHTLLKEIGFIYEQTGKKSLLTEKNDLVKFRQEYLRKINKCREEKRWIIYTGETLISCVKNKSVTSDDVKPTKEISNKKSEEIPNTSLVTNNNLNATILITAPELISEATFIYTIDSGVLAASTYNTVFTLSESQGIINEMSSDSFNTPIKVIRNDKTSDNHISEATTMETTENEICQPKNVPDQILHLKLYHACSDQGFLEGVEFMTFLKSKSMKEDCYESWFIKKLLPKIPPDSVIVTDPNSTPYYKKKRESIPNSCWKKQQIKNWLLSENVNIGDIDHKKELLKLVSNIKPLSSDSKSKITEIAKEKGIKIISIPSFHYELNPLNLAWAQIKNYVKSNSKSFKPKKIKEAIKEGINSIGQVNWINHFNSVKQAEELLQSIDSLDKK